MLTLHLNADTAGSLHLWAEDLREWNHTLDDGDGAFHPFSATGEALCEAMVGHFPHVDLRDFCMDRVELMLPSASDAPLPSPAMAVDDDPPAWEGFDVWTVPALAARGPVLVDLMDALSERPLELRFGDTISYWRSVHALAEQFAAEGHVLPAVRTTGARPAACWRARPSTSEHFSNLRLLREAIPPVARAVVRRTESDSTVDDEPAPSVTNAREVLSAALNALVNAAVRDRLVDYDASPTGVSSGTHDRWYRALAGPDNRFDASPDELSQLQTELDDWSKNWGFVDERGVRLSFRLHPPLGDGEDADGDEPITVPDGPWRVEFLLQAADDPTLIVDAETVWSSTGRTGEILDRRLEHPQEKLLEELGRALPLFSALERALDCSKPTGMELSNTEAHRFLDDAAPMLEQAGFGILAPGWWAEPERRLVRRLEASSTDPDDIEPSVAGINPAELADFRWRIALGDETLTRDELERLAELKMPLVRVNGRWVSLREKDIDHARRFLDGDDAADLSATDALRAASGLNVDDEPLPTVGADFDGVLDKLFDADLGEHLDEAATPKGFDGRLRDYQQRGLAWIGFLERLGFGGCLADDMGLGKTIQVLARLLQERSVHGPESIDTTLVVAPLSVVGNWKSEAEEFAPELDASVHHGPDRASGDELAGLVADHDLVVTTYGVTRNDIDELNRFRWHRVVLDEAQKIKNSSAKRTRAIRTLRANHRLALTGTPVENRLTELWSIMEFLNPGLLGDKKSFRRQIARPIEFNGDERAARLLRRLTGPFILRRHKTDETIIDDLPEKVEIKERCHLTEEQVTLYKAATDAAMDVIQTSEGMSRRGQILKLIQNLKQICNHPRQYESQGPIGGRSGKLDRLEQLAEDILDAGDRALVFTQSPPMAHMIDRRLRERFGITPLVLDGSTPQKKRDEMVELFQSEDGPAFFLLSLRAAGTGLNLTAANHVIHYDRWWNPAVEDQATDRTFRIGQTEDVQVRKLICRGTIEDAIDRTIERKRRLADQVLADGDDWLTELDTDELRDLVALSEERLEKTTARETTD